MMFIEAAKRDGQKRTSHLLFEQEVHNHMRQDIPCWNEYVAI